MIKAKLLKNSFGKNETSKEKLDNKSNDSKNNKNEKTSKSDKTKKGGYIITSGILTERKNEVIDALSSVGFAEVESCDEDGWSAVVFEIVRDQLILWTPECFSFTRNVK